MKVELFYDQECPFCREYSKFVMLRKKYDISIYNARENISVLINFRNQGYDINTGMIVQIDGHKIYHGADAAKKLDELIENKCFLDKCISKIVKAPGFKTIVYPTVKLIRNILLRLLGKNPNIKY